MTHKQYIDGLRAVADFYEEHPEIPIPATQGIDNFALDTKEEAVMVAKALGTCKKEYTNSFLTIQKKISDGFRFAFFFSRNQVCTAKVVGKRFVPSYFSPEHEEDVIEWECDPILEDRTSE